MTSMSKWVGKPDWFSLYLYMEYFFKEWTSCVFSDLFAAASFAVVFSFAILLTWDFYQLQLKAKK